MRRKPYTLKWAIVYQGKSYVEVYGKKKAHDLLYQLSQCLDGLGVAPALPISRGERMAHRPDRKNEYHRKWRERNAERLREYQREYRRRRKEQESAGRRSGLGWPHMRRDGE